MARLSFLLFYEKSDPEAYFDRELKKYQLFEACDIREERRTSLAILEFNYHDLLSWDQNINERRCDARKLVNRGCFEEIFRKRYIPSHYQGTT